MISSPHLLAIPADVRARLERYFGFEALAIVDGFGLRIRLLEPAESYSDVSASIAADPFKNDHLVRGVYESSERTIYLRNRSDGTLVHEFVHALDHAQGRPIRNDAALCAAYAAAPGFVTRYAETGCDVDEWFAENVRALLGAANGDYETLTPEMLAAIDPRGYAVCLQALERLTRSMRLAA